MLRVAMVGIGPHAEVIENGGQRRWKRGGQPRCNAFWTRATTYCGETVYDEYTIHMKYCGEYACEFTKIICL